jgi:NAD-dependent deacetylase
MTYSNIAILTGAGISAESGIQTFREPGGLWEQYRIEDVATPEAFMRDPATVLEFYNIRRRQLREDVAPNAAHQALARLEREFGGSVTLITQNVDDLHERGGSHAPLHMHGELFKVRCTRSGQVFRETGDVTPDSRCPCCGEAGRLRPHVVWFGEVPMHMDRIEQALSDCDLFVAIGTSGNVYPAAGFVQLARATGAQTLELNQEPSAVNDAFHEHRAGAAGELVPSWVDELLN